jgi:hypothetical protein
MGKFGKDMMMGFFKNVAFHNSFYKHMMGPFATTDKLLTPVKKNKSQKKINEYKVKKSQYKFSTNLGIITSILEKLNNEYFDKLFNDNNIRIIDDNSRVPEPDYKILI